MLFRIFTFISLGQSGLRQGEWYVLSVPARGPVVLLSLTDKRDNLSDSMTGSNLSSLRHARLLHSSTLISTCENHLQNKASYTRSRQGSHIFCQSQVLSCKWNNCRWAGKMKRNFFLHSQSDFVNYNQFWTNAAISPSYHHISFRFPWKTLLSGPQFLFNVYCRVFTRHKKTVCCHQHLLVLRGVDIICDIIYHLGYCYIQNHIYVSILFTV